MNYSVKVKRKTLQVLLNAAQAGAEPVVEFSKDKGVMAQRAVEVSMDNCEYIAKKLRSVLDSGEDVAAKDSCSVESALELCLKVMLHGAPSDPRDADLWNVAIERAKEAIGG